ncbi:MAG: hypothetical protein NTX25_24010, partial [Proteobacteria bacterium]|nr:hypothetical protein [Pseudomonadota bacterium]
KTIFADRDAWVYTMAGCEQLDRLTVLINKSDNWKNLPIPNGNYEDLMQAGSVNQSILNLAPRSFRVLKIK